MKSCGAHDHSNRICDRVFIEGGSLICSLRGSTIELWPPNNATWVQANSGVDAIYGLSLMLVFFFAPRGFSPGTPAFPAPQKPTFSNFNSIRNQADEEPLCGSASSK